MSNKQGYEAEISDDIIDRLNRHQNEYALTDANIMGILEVIKLSIWETMVNP